MPPESLWNQYNVVGILILAAGIIAAAFYKLWHELLTWIEKQDLKRDAERETQREWEAVQKKESDQRWQEFLERQQKQWLSQDLNHSSVLVKLIDKVDGLTNAVNNHDTWTRAQTENKK
jgi:uncharacterized membrane protein (DUF106 family)